MEAIAYAKLNLTLDITGLDERRYHLLSSVFAEISLADRVALTPSDKGVTMTCDDPTLATGEKNLCIRAANAFLRQFDLTDGFAIHLEKRIPTCAGLGGGSSDAAAVIKMLCEHYSIPTDDPGVLAVARSIGADVPFFLKGGLCHAEGIGDKLTPLPPRIDYVILLVKTNEAASTVDVYRLYDEDAGDCPATTDAFLNALRQGVDPAPYISNQLTLPSSRLCPSVLRLKSDLRALGAVAAEMTGSGSAVFGLFPDEESARTAMNAIKAEFKTICRFVS
ncbi:MAG: 4-(cytidine 5'-diphospho)-2-C-methyl-D-erythritol kinase [Clostridia bacterium]|nr:4-(cytidine 5'-diphospho)-2-C-methyl-D-erythritol kinase [Clostridia bacterium]